MDWELIIRHLFCGTVPAFVILALYFSITNKRSASPFGHIIAAFLFCFYLVGILTMAGVWHHLTVFAPRIVMIPFVDMIRGPVDTALNILLFVPLGLFLPMLYKSFDRIGKAAAAGFIISLSIEAVQMFGCGTTDINDLLTNTAGACIGFCISNRLCRVIPRSWIKTIRMYGAQGRYEPALIYMIVLGVMITIQPFLYDLWFAAGSGGEISVWK